MIFKTESETLENNKKKISVLGSGAWGTALSILLARNGYQVTVWCFEADVADMINQTRCNDRYLPGFALDESIKATTNLAQALSCDTDFVFEAIPIQFLRSVLQDAKNYYNPNQTWVVASKGIENSTLFLPTQIIDDVFKCNVSTVVLSGPSFARDLANNQVTAVDIGSIDINTAKKVTAVVASKTFIPSLISDPIGIQVGGALKNVITIGVGILDGAGYTDNTKAFLITRGLQEMALIAIALGGKQETLYGLSGVGDLILTSMGTLSKNLAIGKRIGNGETIKAIMSESISIPEGINTLKSINQLSEQLNIDLPMCTGLYQIVFEDRSINQFLNEL